MLLATVLTLSLAPQGSQGNLAGVAETLFVDQQTAANNGLGDQADGWFKPAGFHDDPPDTHVPTADRPDFSPGVVPWAISGLEVDAFSTNVNWIACNDYGVASAAADGGLGWAGIVLSTTRGTLGLPGSTIAAEAATGDIAGDTFQYLFPDSVGVSPHLVGETLRAVDSSQVSLAWGTGPGAIEPDVTAFDLFVPLLQGSPSVFGELHADFSGVLFSVSKNTITRVPPAWWGEHTPSGAIVFQSDWDALNHAWTTPSVRFDPATLGLQDQDDVRALAWDSGHGRLLYSSDNTSLDTITFYNIAVPGIGFRTFVLPSGNPVSGEVGLGPGDPVRVDHTDAICAIDPRIKKLGHAIGRVVSTGTLDATLFRGVESGSGSDRFTSVLCRRTSAPLMPVPLGEEVLASLWMSTGTAAVQATELLPTSPTLLAIRPYVPTAALQHDWDAPLRLQRADLDVQWRVQTSSGQTLDRSPWVRIRY